MLIKATNNIAFISLFLFLGGCINIPSPDQDAFNNLKANGNQNLDSDYFTGQSINQTHALDPNAMTEALTARNFSAVKKLVELGASRKVTAPYFRFPDILPNGHWVPSSDDGKWPVTAAELACIRHDIDVSDYLLERFPEEKVNYSRCLLLALNVKNFSYSRKSDEEIAIFARSHPHLDFSSEQEIAEFIRELGSRGANVNILTSQKVRALHDIPPRLAQESIKDLGSMERYACGHLGLAALIDIGLNPNLLGFWFKTALQSKDPEKHELIKYIIDNGIDPNLSGEYRMPTNVDYNQGRLIYETKKELSLLHLSSFFGKPDIYAYLVAAGANPEVVDAEGQTPIAYANRYAHIVEVKEATAAKLAMHQDELARQAEQKSKGDGFAKVLALGLGAVAIGSLDVANDVAIEAMGALSADILSGGGQNTANLYKKAEANALTRSAEQNNAQNKADFLNSVKQEKDALPQSTAKTNCGAKYISEKLKLYNEGGHIACDEVTENCWEYRA
tara:strand:+ start:576 stop:2090 length:1515 start_codon:yes stop_codon:yes gene_type:complete